MATAQLFALRTLPSLPARQLAGAGAILFVLLIWWFLLRAPLVVTDEPLVDYRTYPTKSADATAESLNPTATRRRWLMTSLWRSLWRDAAAPGVDPRVRRVARSELIRCLWHRHWLKHIAWDFYLVAGDLLPRRATPTSASS